MSGVEWPEVGDGVWYRGRYDEQWERGTIRGVCELKRNLNGQAPYGIRLENGNFVWAYAHQLSFRDVPNKELTNTDD